MEENVQLIIGRQGRSSPHASTRSPLSSGPAVVPFTPLSERIKRSHISPSHSPSPTTNILSLRNENAADDDLRSGKSLLLTPTSNRSNHSTDFIRRISMSPKSPTPRMSSTPVRTETTTATSHRIDLFTCSDISDLKALLENDIPPTFIGCLIPDSIWDLKQRYIKNRISLFLDKWDVDGSAKDSSQAALTFYMALLRGDFSNHASHLVVVSGTSYEL